MCWRESAERSDSAHEQEDGGHAIERSERKIAQPSVRCVAERFEAARSDQTDEPCGDDCPGGAQPFKPDERLGTSFVGVPDDVQLFHESPLQHAAEELGNDGKKEEQEETAQAWVH